MNKTGFLKPQFH